MCATGDTVISPHPFQSDCREFLNKLKPWRVAPPCSSHTSSKHPFCPGSSDRSLTQPAQGSSPKEHSLPLPAPRINSSTTTKAPKPNHSTSRSHQLGGDWKRPMEKPWAQSQEEHNCISGWGCLIPRDGVPCQLSAHLVLAQTSSTEGLG